MDRIDRIYRVNPCSKKQGIDRIYKINRIRAKQIRKELEVFESC